MDGRSKRLDAFLVEKGFASGRERAKEQIRAGKVLVNGRTVTKPSALVEDHADIRCEGGCPYVGRGGLKLEKAVREASLKLDGVTALDIGASTGGFTDCMLRFGAARVYAVDVGHGQLHPTLRMDPRVVSLEGVDVRSEALASAIPPGTASFAAADVSFISEKAVLPFLLPYLAPSARLVVLIKPQFEAGRQAVGKNGVVRDPRIHRRVLDEMLRFFAEEGLHLDWLSHSPVTGGEGNIEYLAVLTVPPVSGTPLFPDTRAIVERAFSSFSRRLNPA